MTMQMLRGVVLLGLIAGAMACAKKDSVCWSLEATKLSNIVRVKNGGKPTLRAGPAAMLDNAVEHSKYMLHTGSFYHQDLSMVSARINSCGLMCSGENIARSRKIKNETPAETCLHMWETSPGHLENIMMNGEITVIGIAFGNGGDFYCTQTFAKVDSNADNYESEDVCKSIDKSGEMDDEFGESVPSEGDSGEPELSEKESGKREGTSGDGATSGWDEAERENGNEIPTEPQTIAASEPADLGQCVQTCISQK